MAVQFLAAYNSYQARIYPRGPGRTKCFSVGEYGDAGARRRAEQWEKKHKHPPVPKPATSTRSSSGLRGIGFKWAHGVLCIVVNVTGAKTTRSEREHGAPHALRLAVAAATRAGVPPPSKSEFAAALHALRAMLREGPPKRSRKAAQS